MITGSVYIALPETEHCEQASADRRALDVLRQCPDGAHVIVDLGERVYPSQDAALWLHQHDHRLRIDIRGCDPAVVDRFVRAARAGMWEVA